MLLRSQWQHSHSDPWEVTPPGFSSTASRSGFQEPPSPMQCSPLAMVAINHLYSPIPGTRQARLRAALLPAVPSSSLCWEGKAGSHSNTGCSHKTTLVIQQFPWIRDSLETQLGQITDALHKSLLKLSPSRV